jgi:SulP family sulfate permease
MLQALRSIGAGLVASLLSVAYCFSYGALIFSGPLERFLAEGVASALVTAAITATVVACTSSFRSAVAGPDSNTAAPLASMMASLAPTIATMSSSDAVALSLASLMATTLLTGVVLFLLGWKRLGKLIRFVPYPVVAGFLAATGWLMLSGAVKMATGVPLSIGSLSNFLDAGIAEVLGVTAILAAVLWYLTSRWKHPLVLLLALVAAVLATHGITAIVEFDPKVISRLMFTLPNGLHPVIPFVTFDVFRVNLSALTSVAGDMVAVSVLAVLSILLNSASIEMATGVEADLDRELRVQGIANLASAASGGFVGYISVSRTLVNVAAGGVTRLSGVVVGLVALAILIMGSETISYVPRFVLSGLLLQLGARLIWDWGILSRRVLPFPDWLIVLAIILLTYSVGFLEALLFGVLAGCVIFAIDVSRVRVIRHQFGLNERSSSFVRSREESAFFLEHGGRVQILELSGFIFFGSAYSLLEKMKSLVAEHQPKIVIFDFSDVSGIDSSAGASFTKIRELLHKSGARQIMVAMLARVTGILSASVALGDNVQYHDNLDAALEAAEEEMLLAYNVSSSLRGTVVDWLTEVVGSRADAEALFGRMIPAPRDSNAYLCHEGDPTDDLLFIERGPVSVILNRGDQAGLRVRVFGAHTLAGEIGFFLNVPRSASLRAAHDAVVWSLSRASYNEFISDRPQVALALATYVVRLQSERLLFANRQIEALQR